MRSKTSLVIMKDIANKYCLPVSDIQNICESQYSAAKSAMSLVNLVQDGDMIRTKAPAVKLYCLGTFFVSEHILKHLSAKLFSMDKNRVDLVIDKY